MKQGVTGYSLVHAELMLAAAGYSGEGHVGLDPSVRWPVVVGAAAHHIAASFAADGFLGFGLDEREWRWASDIDCSVEIVHFVGTGEAVRGIAAAGRFVGSHWRVEGSDSVPA